MVLRTLVVAVVVNYFRAVMALRVVLVVEVMVMVLPVL
jgi:hypothetical protein